MGDRRWPLEERRQLGELRAFESATREPILRHFEASAGFPHLPTKCRHFGDRHADLLGHDDQLGLHERSMQGVDQLLLLCSVHYRLRCLGPFRMSPSRPGCTWIHRAGPVDPVRLSQKFKPPTAADSRPKTVGLCLMQAPKRLSPSGRAPEDTCSLGQGGRTKPTGSAFPRPPPALPAARPGTSEETSAQQAGDLQLHARPHGRGPAHPPPTSSPPPPPPRISLPPHPP